MTIIFEHGGIFWIEHLTLANISILDAADRIISTAVNLERPGRYIGGVLTPISAPDNDNSQAIGHVDMRSEAATTLIYGTRISGITWRIDKQAGTAGATIIGAHAIIFLRK